MFSLVPRPSRGVERTAWDVLLAQARRLSALVRILVRYTKPTHVDHIRTKNSSQYAKYGRLSAVQLKHSIASFSDVGL